MRRRLLWLLVLSAAAAAAVAYQLGKRSRQVLAGGDAWTTFGAPDTATAQPRSGPRREEPTGEEGPAEAPPMVVATMEATPAPADVRFEHNGGPGAVTAPEPAKIGPEAALGSIDLGRAEPTAKRRTSGVMLAVLGTLAGAGAVALGAWGIASNVNGDDQPAETPAAVENVQQVVSLIAKPTTATIPLKGSGSRIILVVGARGYGVLVLDNLTAPPAGKTYQAWVIKPNVKAPQSAGLFAGGTGVVKLTTSVPRGGIVAITVEPAGGSPAPTQTPKLLAKRAPA